MERLKELELVLQNQGPYRDADVAFGNELVRRRRGDQRGLPGTVAALAIAVAMIVANMGTDRGFEDNAVIAAGNFDIGYAANAAQALVGGQATRFMLHGEVIVVT